MSPIVGAIAFLMIWLASVVLAVAGTAGWAVWVAIEACAYLSREKK